MSADPQSKLSKLWQSFGAGAALDEGGGACELNGAGGSNSTEEDMNGSNAQPPVSPEQSQQTNNLNTQYNNSNGHNNANNSSNNNNRNNNSSGNNNINSNSNSNNYVNFDQFIMQHNLRGHNAVNGGFGNYGPVQYENGVSKHGNEANFGHPENSFFAYTPTSANGTSNGVDNFPSPTNVFNPNSNLFPSSDSNTSNNYSNGLTTYNMYNQPYYDTAAYNPYATSPQFIVNPFSTGFNFNFSNLQANAPEFVPRFNNFSLNEYDRTSSSATAYDESALATINHLTDQLQIASNDSDINAKYVKNKNALETLDGAQINNGSNLKNVDAASTSSSARPFTAGMSSNTSSNSRPTSAADSCTGATSKPFIPFNSINGEEKMSSYPIEPVAEQRDRERDNRRSDKGRRHNRDREREYYQRYDNHRSNKRRDDWNRNRDRINGFRVEEKYSTENGKDSPIPSPEKKLSPKKAELENEKLSQREKLMRDIEMRRLECLVCVENIKSHHSVWSCQNCYHILHLQCIIKWASSSKVDGGWRCPACQNVLKDIPRDYYCFCGKVKNPQYNRQEIAHSCGEMCGRIEHCPHACTLLCHPGPCPPCQANVKRECGCGKTTKTMQCCLKEAFECDAKCEKILNCEVHKCESKCHAGKCGPCKRPVKQQCHCSKQEREVACTRDSHDKHLYSCGKPCGKDLACSNHKCKDCCHAGDCRPCKFSPEVITSCPCGKMPIQKGERTSCLDAIPVCEGVCGKTLRCGKPAHPHHCTSKCHLGNCPPCNKQTAVKCRCGHMDQLIKCRQLSSRADDARCKKRCTKKRSCGKHKCNQECCIDIDHTCPLPCNYTLSCGKHKCDQPCHRGNCPPCYRSSFDELYCECGAEVIFPPVPCGTKRPICKRPCSRTHPCSHQPQHNCHAAPVCPPCMMFTVKWCFGHHEQRKTIPCSQQSFSCGLPCNKPLPCGRHKCIKSCHEGNCQVAGEVCKQSCNALRASCGHKCMGPCHDGDCPETQCKEMVEVQCDCGNRKQMRACHDLAREYSRIATAQLASSMAEMQRGNYMELSEILAPVKMHKTNKTLDCNDECRTLERNRRLAIGLQIRNPDLPQKLLTKYSDFIRNFAKRDPVLVKSIHDSLTNLVKLAKESKQKSRSHSFPTMNREKRQLVHEMCEMFGVESVAYDAEPNRNVVATAYKDRSWLPATSIMEVMQRESGQRRVPVPSNNAWGNRR